MKYITDSGSQTIGIVDAILVQVNGALTGTLTLAGDGNVFAVITNPGVGAIFKYGGLRSLGVVTINPSATTDVTVSILDRIS